MRAVERIERVDTNEYKSGGDRRGLHKRGGIGALVPLMGLSIVASVTTAGLIYS